MEVVEGYWMWLVVWMLLVWLGLTMLNSMDHPSAVQDMSGILVAPCTIFNVLYEHIIGIRGSAVCVLLLGVAQGVGCRIHLLMPKMFLRALLGHTLTTRLQRHDPLFSFSAQLSGQWARRAWSSGKRRGSRS